MSYDLHPYFSHLLNGTDPSPSGWMAPEDLEKYARLKKRLVEGSLDEASACFRTRLSPEGVFSIKLVRTSLFGDDGGFIGTIQDVSEIVAIESRIKSSTSLLNTILENVPVAVFCKDPEDGYKYVIWNRKMEEHTGIPAEKAIGHTDFEIMTFPGSEADFRRDDEFVMGSKSAVDIVEDIRNLAGRRYVVRTIKAPLRLGDGKSLLLGISLDITKSVDGERERAKLLEEIATYAKLEEVVNDCLSILVSNDDFSNTLKGVLERLGSTVGADFCGIYKFSEDHSKVFFDSGWQASKDATLITEYDASEDMAWLQTMRAKRPIMADDIENSVMVDAKTREYFKMEKLKSVMAVGLWQNGTLWGFISIAFTKSKRNFNHFDESFMQSVASSIEIAMTRNGFLQRLMRNEYEKNLIFDNVDIPILFYDASGNLISVNKIIPQTLGISREEILSKPCYATLCRYGGKPAHCPIEKVIATKGAQTFKYSGFGHDYIATAIPITDGDGKLVNIVESLVDVTLQNRAIEEIRKAKDEAESASRAKSGFLANMSHEIRTPLNAIIGLSELLKDEPEIPNRCAENIQSINTAGSALLSIINDILEISKIEAGKVEMSFDWIRHNMVLDEMVSIFEPLAAKNGIFFKMEVPDGLPEIYFSATNLRQILLNLIGNAIKFTKSGGVTLSCYASPCETPGCTDVHIDIADTGCGIPKDDIGRIFNPFEQSLQSKRVSETKGTGLGLAIVSRLVEKLGGKISLESGAGKGSVFSLTFSGVKCRKAEDAGEDASEIRGETRDFSGAKIWVLDDVELNCKVLSMMLKKLGADGEYMTSAAKILERLASGEKPDIIMTDMWMPEMTGTEFAAAVRNIPSCAKIPIVAVTADTEAEQNFKMDDFAASLLKPVTMEKLQYALSSAVPKTE